MEVLHAIADPTRRRIVELLAEHDRTAGDISAEFAISRPAVSRHLRVLRESGLVTAEARAQQRVYRLEPRPLAELDAWLSRYRTFWAGRLDDLETHLEAKEQS